MNPTHPSALRLTLRILTQLAHRLLALAIWLVAARIALGLFDYDRGISAWILRATIVALNTALVAAFAGYWIARVAHLPADEPRKLLTPTLVLIAITMAVAILASH